MELKVQMVLQDLKVPQAHKVLKETKVKMDL